MPDVGKQILETMEKVIPTLTEMEKEKLLSFGEGMAFKAGCKAENTETVAFVSGKG